MANARKLIEQKVKEQLDAPGTCFEYVCLDSGASFCTKDVPAKFNPFTGGTQDFVAQSDFDSNGISDMSAGVDFDELGSTGGEGDDIYVGEDLDPTAYMEPTPVPGSQANPMLQKPLALNPGDPQPDDPVYGQNDPLFANPADDDKDEIGPDTAAGQGFVPGYPQSGVPPFQTMTPGMRTDR